MRRAVTSGLAGVVLAGLAIPFLGVAPAVAGPAPVGGGDVFAEDFADGLDDWTALTGALSDWSVEDGTLSVDTRGRASGRYIRPTAPLTLPDAYELKTSIRVDEIESSGDTGTISIMLDMLAPDDIKSDNLAVQLTKADSEGRPTVRVATPLGSDPVCSGYTPLEAGEWAGLTIRRAGGITALWVADQLVLAVSSTGAGGTFGIGSYKAAYSLGPVSIDALTGVPDDQPKTATGCSWVEQPDQPDPGAGSGTVSGDGNWVPAAAASSDRPGHEVTAGEGVISLDGDWRFTTDPSGDGEEAGYTDPATDVGDWDTLSVPGNWDVHDRYGRYRGAGWYRTTFQTGDLSAEDGERAWLRFGAVYWESSVWLNGNLLGSHIGGYTPFEFDVSRYLVDGENTLVVRADNSFSQGAWWSWGGISRSVHLVKTDELGILRQEVVATPDLGAGTAEVTSTVFLRNSGDTDRTVTVSGGIATDAGSPVDATGTLSASATVPAGGTASVELTAELASGSFDLWNLDDPNLYRFDATLAVDGETVHAVGDRFGIRSFVIDGTSFLLNGQKVKLAGANRVSDNPIDGNTEPIATVRRDLDRMKAAGMNFSRIMHYPQSPELLDYADEIGMLLIAENPVWGGARDLVNDISQIQHEFREMVERDVNHPSIIAYSVANEIASNSAAGIAYDRIMADFARSLDPSRYVTQVSNKINAIDSGEQDGSQYMDFVSVNMYGGFAAAADHTHEMYPDVPIFVSEYSPDSFTFDVGRESLDFDTRSGTAAAAFAARGFVAGWSQWTYNDYRSDYSGSSANLVRGWGDVDVWGREKVAYDTVQAANAPVSSLKISNIASDDGSSLGLVTIVPRPSSSTDGPAWLLSGYRLVVRVADVSGSIVGGTMLALDDIAPGSDPIELPVSWADGGAGVTAEVALLSPTGYEVAHTRAGIRAPAAPEITETVAASESIRVRYSDAAATGSYHVEARTPDGNVVAEVDTAEEFADLDGLSDGTEYTIAVSAVNGTGPGPADTVSATPGGDLTMAPEVVALASVDHGLVLGFSDPTAGAEFEVAVSDATTGEEVQDYTTSNRPGTRIENLKAGAGYDVKIRRLDGGNPATVWSEPLRQTAGGPSSAPALDVHGTVAGATAGGIVITPTAGTERYLVSVSGPGGDRSYPYERAAVDLVPVTGLQPGATYQVTLRSESATGRSAAWSGIITTRSQGDGGSVAAPVDLGYETRGDNVVLTWESGSDEPVDGYLVTASSCGTETRTTVLAAELTIGELGFSGGSYRVQAVRAGVLSEPSTDLTVPGRSACTYVVTVDDTETRDDGTTPFTASAGWQPSSVTAPGGYRSLYAEVASNPDATATWTAPRVGDVRFAVEVGIPDSYGSSAAVYTVQAADGDHEIVVNQGEKKNSWVRLGQFDFTADAPGNVTISGGGDNYLRASAVRFVTVPSDESPSLELSERVVVAGGSVTVSGSGFWPGETVEVTLHSDSALLAEMTADDAGAFSEPVEIPADTAPGEHEVVATGAGSGRVSAKLAVRPEPGSGDDGGPGGAGDSTAGGSGSTGGSAGDDSGSRSPDDALASTGSETDGILPAALVLLALGAGVLLARRRRAHP